MKLGIVGSSGFIGTHLTKRLLSENHELVEINSSAGIDACDWEQIKDFTGLDIVIHLANRSFVPDSYNVPRLFYQNNINSTLNVLELCRLNNSKLIYLSSYLYGEPEYLPIDESHPLKPFNPYAQSKLICESLCEGYSRDFNIPCVVIRPFNIYGPHQNKNFLIPTILDQASSNKVTIKDDRPKRDYLHVEDLVAGIVSSMTYLNDKTNGIEVFNMGFGQSHSVKEVIDIIRSIPSVDFEYSCLNEVRPNEVMDTVANIGKANKRLKWYPKIDLYTGLAAMLQR